MSPPGIVEAVDVFEQGRFDLPSGFPTPTPDRLSLEGLEESLDGGIVEAIALAAHRNLEVVPTQERLIVVAAILRASVSAVDAARWRLAQVDGHLQRPDREIAFHAVADGPTDHAARIEVDDHGEIKPALSGPE